MADVADPLAKGIEINKRVSGKRKQLDLAARRS